jgi:signal peptidase I
VTLTNRRLPLRRFVVHDRSMLPALQPGDGLLASSCWPVRVGQLRCLPDPSTPGRWLVKRVTGVRGERMTVHSDNLDATTLDSRAFGQVPVAGSYAVLLRIPARLLR